MRGLVGGIVVVFALFVGSGAAAADVPPEPAKKGCSVDGAPAGPAAMLGLVLVGLARRRRGEG